MRLQVSLLALALAACQPALINGKPNEDSPYFEIPAGTKFVLRRDINVPPRMDRVYFQGGRVLVWYRVNKYRPYCVLRLDSARNHEHTIEPDEFAVTKVSTAHFFELARAETERARRTDDVPGRRLLATDDRQSDSGDDYETFGSVLQLHSVRQPDVKQLICADWGLPQRAPYITVRKIRGALNGYFYVEIAPS